MKLRIALAALAVTAASVLAGAPASAVPNMSLVSAVSAVDSTAEKSAQASCPTGTRVLGGGGFISGGNRQVHFTRLQALGSFDDFAVSAAEISAYASAWQVHAYAICGTAPAGLEYVSFVTGSDSSASKAATATCPAGKQLISTGARVINGDGRVVINSLVPSAALTATTSTAYEAQGGFAGNWSLYSHGVCANPLPGLQLVSALIGPDSNDDVVGASCPAGKFTHGLGATMSSPAGQALYGGLYPSAALDQTVAIALEDADGYAANWSTRVYAICAN
ncbi:hypothetical protein [Catellatospora vulcania]|uniref:hypothetical protein n=1 Tax=Catellatospora vulcania TaxID=1460450 RepID=UPI0012D3E547|nr:hypothetical protein [Catellatospora vulcania]